MVDSNRDKICMLCPLLKPCNKPSTVVKEEVVDTDFMSL